MIRHTPNNKFENFMMVVCWCVAVGLRVAVLVCDYVLVFSCLLVFLCDFLVSFVFREKTEGDSLRTVPF